MKIEPKHNIGMELIPENKWEFVFLMQEEEIGYTFVLKHVINNKGEESFILERKA